MDGIPIREAAARLGITVESLRKRAQRGTITAYKVDGEWFIALPAEQDKGQDAVPDNGQGGDIATSALVEQLGFMQRELERRDLEIERLTGMLAESQRTVRLMLPTTAGPGQDTIQPTPGTPQAPERSAEHAMPPETAPVAPDGSQREIEGFWHRVGRILRGQ